MGDVTTLEREVVLDSDAGGRRRSPWRRRLKWIAAALAVVLIGAGIWFVRWVNEYQPLVIDNVNGLTAIRGQRLDASGVTRIDNLLGDEIRFANHAGGPVIVWEDLRNEGSRPVRIDAVPFDAPSAYYKLEQVRLGDYDDRSFTPTDSTAFRPFTLPPHRGRVLVLFFRQNSCSEPSGGSWIWQTQRVTFTVLGVHRDVSVPMRRAALSVELSNCP